MWSVSSFVCRPLLLRYKNLNLYYNCMNMRQISQKRTAKNLLCSTAVGPGQKGSPITLWLNYVEDLSWSRLAIPLQYLLFHWGSRCLQAPTWTAAPHDPPTISGSRWGIFEVEMCVASGGAHPRNSAPGQHSSEETRQAVGNTASRYNLHGNRTYDTPP